MTAGHQAVVREEVREAILDSVDRLLVRYGYQKTTVEDIAREAGIGKGTVYLYFPSKEEVALGSFDRAHEVMMKHIRTILECDLPPDRKLRDALVARVMLSFDGTQQFVQSLDELFAAVRPALLARRERYRQEEAEMILRVLENGCAEGVFEVKDIRLAAHAIVQSISGFLPYSLSVAQLGRREDIAAKIEMLAGLLLDGLRRRSQQS